MSDPPRPPASVLVLDLDKLRINQGQGNGSRVGRKLYICRSCRASWKLLEVVWLRGVRSPSSSRGTKSRYWGTWLRPLAEFSSRAGRLREETVGGRCASLSATFWTLTVSVVTQRLGWLSCVVIGCVVCSQTLATTARRPCAPSCHQVRYPAGAPNTSPFFSH